MARATRAPSAKKTETYQHPQADLPMRPEVGVQPKFRRTKAPQKYRFDSSLAPELVWDGQNPARETGEALIARLTAHGLRLAELATAPASAEREAEIARLRAELLEAEGRLRKISGPFLNWSGKAERLSFEVPTLPLFVHERLSTKAIIETLKGHQHNQQEDFFGTFFGVAERSVTDQVLKAYEYRDDWVNRMMLGDSLVVMNSLLHYEGLGGQVQMIYIDPPYGVKFGSNFQPFVRKRDVSHGDDEDMTREPEMVQAYRDTWELGLHSYLTYLRDRLLLARDLLAPSGSVFVQISDENLHHVREVMDEVFGAENFCSIIAFAKTTGFESSVISAAGDYLVWYGRDRERAKYQPLYVTADREPGTGGYRWIMLPDGTCRSLKATELIGEEPIPDQARLYAPDNLVAQGAASEPQPFVFKGKRYEPPAGSHWKANYPTGMNRLADANRLHASKNTLRFVRYADDFPWQDLNSLWSDTLTGQFTDPKSYVVQTNSKVIERCLLMTTDPGDLVLDPTCGSGTTAYVAEQWGRRWITCDTSRVPLALARQRILTATFRYYQLRDPERGPSGGYIYERKQNRKGEEIGGIVRHITLKSIANNEPPAEEVLVDRPEVLKGVTRVSGPFSFEATIPTSLDVEGGSDPAVPAGGESAPAGTERVDRILEALRQSPVLRLEGNRTVQLRGVRQPAQTLSLSAEALQVNGEDKPVAFVFGPENGAVSERLVRTAHDEASMKSRGFAHLYVIGFAIEPNARQYIDAAAQMGIPATYVQATPDLLMGDLLKNMRSSQIFSVCGLPEVTVLRLPDPETGQPKTGEFRTGVSWQVELGGLDVFDPISMEVDHIAGNDVPAWFLDTDYNGLVFHVTQAFFPRTGAWENLKKVLKADYADGVWDHLAGTKSAPFEAGVHRQIAVKVIDQRGNELLVVKKLEVAS